MSAVSSRLEMSADYGLDIGPAIRWYEANAHALLRRIESRLNVPRSAGKTYPLENPSLLQLKNTDITRLTGIIPQAGLDRAIVQKIVGKPATWLHKRSLPFTPEPATDITRRLSPTAIITSAIDTSPWTDINRPVADMWLYQIPEELCSSDVKKILQYRAFCREVVYSLSFRPRDTTYALEQLGGTRKNANDIFVQLSILTEAKPPISAYSAAFRTETGRFIETSQDFAWKALQEECAETGVAYLLGFSYCGDHERNMHPFQDRPDVHAWMRDFLNARVVNTIL